MAAGIRSAELRVIAQFVSPLWLNSLPNEETTTVNPDGTITLNGQPMRTREASPFAPGERATIRVRQPRTAYDADALAADEARQAQASRVACEQEQDAVAARAAAAVQNNKDLRVPVSWRPEI
jgi:hypothetical protein